MSYRISKVIDLENDTALFVIGQENDAVAALADISSLVLTDFFWN